MTYVADSTGAALDDALPMLRLALDPVTAHRQLTEHLGLHAGAELERIEVVRHKPGRRAIVEYRVNRPEGPGSGPLAVLGKVRVRRYGKSGLRRLRSFRDAGFSPTATDGIAVPEPLGHIPEFRMWLQRKVPGTTLTGVLATDGGVAAARRAAEVAHKVHRAGVPTDDTHDLADEVAILRRHLPSVVQWWPDLAGRVSRLLDACDRRVAGARPGPPCGVHRDFYGDQVLVDGPRAWLLDLDLYCLGDPALDAGNFLGHVVELAIRSADEAPALAAAESAMRDRFLELHGRGSAPMVDLYTDLTLARHVYLSAVRPARRPYTPAIVAACEERFGL